MLEGSDTAQSSLEITSFKERSFHVVTQTWMAPQKSSFTEKDYVFGKDSWENLFLLKKNFSLLQNFNCCEKMKNGNKPSESSHMLWLSGMSNWLHFFPVCIYCKSLRGTFLSFCVDCGASCGQKWYCLPSQGSCLAQAFVLEESERNMTFICIKTSSAINTKHWNEKEKYPPALNYRE